MQGIGYNFLAIFIYGFCGIPIYLKMYRYTKDKRAFILLLSVIILFLGYLITSFTDIYKIYHAEFSPFLQLVKNFGDYFPILGLLLFLLIYSKNIGYIYRIPFDNYYLLVFHKKSALILTEIEFQTKTHQIEIKPNIFSSLISALNHVYSNVFNSDSGIRRIKSNEVSILIENGKYISVLLATDKTTRVLFRGIKKFVKEYEIQFKQELNSQKCPLTGINAGDQIFFKIFPHIKLKKRE
ncbi:MAG: hypothetical protein ACTSWL_02310 [Promethearchaeota archaeon]